MSRPTKEEAAQWARTLDGVAADVLDFSRLDAHALAGFLRRVAAALPSAAAVQRDRERRKRQADQGVPLCRGCHTHHDSGELCPE